MDSPQGEIMAKNKTIKIKILNPAMGVPITYLDKHNPEQFEIVGSFNNSQISTKMKECYVGSIDTKTMINGSLKMWNGPVINENPLYKRIVIRQRRQ